MIMLAVLRVVCGYQSHRKSSKTLNEFFKKPVLRTGFLQRLNYCLITLFRQGLRGACLKKMAVMAKCLRGSFLDGLLQYAEFDFNDVFGNVANHAKSQAKKKGKGAKFAGFGFPGQVANNEQHQ
jgi:hypothetical protein